MNDDIESSLKQNQKIGSILIRRGQLRKFQLDFILRLQKTYGSSHRFQKLGELLVGHRVISSLALTEALAVQEEMPKESITQVIRVLESFHDQTQATKLIANS